MIIALKGKKPKIGKDVCIAESAQVIGEVTIGNYSIIHGCRIENNCLIGMGAIILDRARIEKNCLIGAGSLVPEGKIIPEGSLVLGVPGREVRKLNQKEIKKLKDAALEYLDFAERFKGK